MKDEVEQQDHLLTKDVGPEDPSILGKVYPRSLLYLVSGVCEYFEGQGGSGVHSLDGSDMPILGMDRFYQQQATFSAATYPSVELVRTDFPKPPATPEFARVLSPTDDTAPPGFRSTALQTREFSWGRAHNRELAPLLHRWPVKRFEAEQAKGESER